MIDLIFFCFFLATFCGGFLCGKKFLTAQAAWIAFKAYVSSLFA